MSAGTRDFVAEIKEWSKVNVLWIVIYVINLLFGITIYISNILEGESSFPILTIVISLCIIFVYIFTYPIEALPVEGSTQDERKRIEEIRSRQRNTWMIFAYSFMMVSFLLTFLPLINPLFSFAEKISVQSDGTLQQESTGQNTAKPDAGRYLKTLRERPIAVFVGCSLDPKAKTLLCPTSDAKPEDDTQKAQNPISGTTGSAWVINIGGHIQQCTVDGNKGFGMSIICQVKDGLLIPLYFIILALMGGSVSLTRRLPELQKQASSEHIATEQQPKLSQYEFRERLIFQMVQFISAPLLAILAYYLIEPGNITHSVVLAFIAGFASETILLMVQSIANKITLKSGEASGKALQYGSVAGVITIQDVAAKKAEVFLTELPQIHSITDEQGFYVLSNVPVGEHSISVKSGGTEAILKKDTVKIDRAQAIVKKNMAITAPDEGQK